MRGADGRTDLVSRYYIAAPLLEQLLAVNARVPTSSLR